MTSPNSILKLEIKTNAQAFLNDLPTLFSGGYSQLLTDRDKLIDLYSLAVTLNAWRVDIVEQHASQNALNFFEEAQNDSLLSISLAAHGVWRSALQSLRACMENLLSALYYFDHPIELRLWESGEHLKPSFLMNYFSSHPDVSILNSEFSTLETLKAEYSELSKAVHGSKISYRMTSSGFPSLIIAESTQLGKFSTRYKKTFFAFNELLMLIYAEKLKGTQARRLRNLLSVTLPPRMKQKAETNLGIVFPT